MTQARDPLLETKLHVPRAARVIVPRQRLREKLGAGAGSALTLVSAPAGFGKTTLLTEWIAALPRDGPSVGWLSLDEADNDPSLFWKYFVAALRSVAGEDVGAGALLLLESSQTPVDAMLRTLINDLCGLPGDVILVLDDYHVIEAREVHDGVVFLLDHLPAHVHVVIASRADPPFSLARWRGDGELTEIRAADLRFTPDETATYLDGTVGDALTAQDVATLDQRTEGWVAALQLAALSMQGRDDLRSFIEGFAGDDRYIVDYLVEEVMQRQPDEVRCGHRSGERRSHSRDVGAREPVPRPAG
jgi:LuxR family maltose regulon positive regulatory protein